MAKQNQTAAEKKAAEAKAAAEKAAAEKAAAEKATDAADPEGSERVEKSKETIHTSPQAKPEEKAKLYKTSDGEKFYQHTYALMHARELEDSTITEA